LYQVVTHSKTAAGTSLTERHGRRLSFSIFIVPISDSHMALVDASADGTHAGDEPLGGEPTRVWWLALELYVKSMRTRGSSTARTARPVGCIYSDCASERRKRVDPCLALLPE